MKSSTLLRFVVCLFFFSFSIYSYIDKQNRCTELSMRLPRIVKEIETIREENAALQYQIECFESPEQLLTLAARTEYAHLKYPFEKQIVTLKEGLALQSTPTGDDSSEPAKVKTPLVIGAK